MRRPSLALPLLAFLSLASCAGEGDGTEPTLNFTLSVDPTALTIETGSNRTAAITIGRTGGFTGAVNLSVANLPAGVTASFDNPSPTGTAAILTLTVSGNAAAGTTNLSVDGAGAPGTRSAPLALTLTTPPGNTTWKFCDLGNLPIHFAYQDGAGPWTEAEGDVTPGGTTYRFPMGSATGGVAFVEGSGSINGFAVLVYYGTQAELQALGDNQCVAHPNLSRTIHAFVTGVGPTDWTFVSLGTAWKSPIGVTNFQFENVLDGPADLIATRATSTPDFTFTPVKMIIRRGVDIPDGGSIPTLDFGSGEAFDPVTALLTVNNLNGDQWVSEVYFPTAENQGPLYLSSGAGGSSRTIYGVPSGWQAPVDLHAIRVSANHLGGSRSHTVWTRNLTDRTITLGDQLTPPALTSLGNSPYPRWQATGPIQSDYDESFVFSMGQSGNGPGESRRWVITASRAIYSGGNYSLVIPDLSGTAGWENLWGLRVGQIAGAAVSASSTTASGAPAEGIVQRTASRIESVTP